MLPVRIPPLKDEILSSWIVRLSVVNGTDPMGIGYGIWGEWRGWTRDIDRQLPERYRKQLATLTGIDEDRIFHMTLEPYVARLYPDGVLPNRFVRWAGVIPLGSRNRTRTNGLHFCPECLAEGVPYAQREWRASWVSACPKHGRILALACPKCHHVFSPHMIDYAHPHFSRCVQCGFDLTQTKMPQADQDVIALQMSLSRMIWEHAPADEIYSSGLEKEGAIEAYDFVFDLLRVFRYFDIAPKLPFVPLYQKWVGETPPQTFRERITGIEMLSAEDRHLYWRMVAQVLHRGEEAFVSLLQSHEVTYAAIHNGALRSKRASRTIHRIAQQFEHTPVGKRKKRVQAIEENIEPRSLLEVEEIMQTIRTYL